MTIPPALLRLMDIDIGAQVTLTVKDRTLVAKPAPTARKRYSLADLLKGNDAVKRLNSDVAWARDGGPVGHELI